MKVPGPGHNSVVQTPKGDYYCIYPDHTDYDNPSGDRQVYITPLIFKNGSISIEHPMVK